MLTNFEWDPSTSVANLTTEQVTQLCSLLNSSNNLPGSISSPVHSLREVHMHPRPSTMMAISIGFVFVSLINLCAVAGIGVMRYLSKNVYNQVITFFVGLGVGSLTGSSFYHLLPNAHPALVEEVDEFGHPTHAYLKMAHFSLLGVYMFFMCDKIIKIVLEFKKKSRGAECSTAETGKAGWMVERKGSGDASDRSEKPLLNGCHKKSCDDIPMQIISGASGAFGGSRMSEQAHGVCVHDHSIEWTVGQGSGQAIAAVAWMIIFGDGFHNLIDGVSIGAAFSESIHSGVSVVVAVLCEEFPHELGDVAILVASGMTLRQALIYNLLSAMTCYLGFAFGVIVGELGPDSTKYAFGLAGGMFLYISLGCMMPEMKKAMEEALEVSMAHGIKVLILQTVGMFCGLTLMYVMSRYGEEISI